MLTLVESQYTHMKPMSKTVHL